MKKNKSQLKKIVKFLSCILMIILGIYFNVGEENLTDTIIENNKMYQSISNIPEYSGDIIIEINNNIPEFTTEEINVKEEEYSQLESGRVRCSNGENELGKS